MGGITQILAGTGELVLSADFIANVIVLVIFMESLSVICGAFASLGR